MGFRTRILSRLGLVQVDDLNAAIDALGADRAAFDSEVGWARRALHDARDWNGIGSSKDRDTKVMPPCDPGLDLQDFRDIARYNPIARRILWVRALRIAIAGWSVNGGEDGADVGVTADEDERLDVRTVLAEALGKAERDGGSYILAFDGRPLDEPLNGSPITALRVRTCDEIIPHEVVEDLEGGRRMGGYYLSNKYGTSEISGEVDDSRVVYVPGTQVDFEERYNSQWRVDDSLLVSVWKYVARVDITGGAGANIARMLSLRVLKTDLEGGGSGFLEAISLKAKVLARLQSVVGVTLLSKDEDMQVLGSNTTGFRELSEEQWAGLSSASQMPQTLIRGDTPAGLSTDGQSARKAINDAVMGYAEIKVRPVLREVHDLIETQNGVSFGDGALKFNPADPPTRAELADIGLKLAQRDQTLVSIGAIEPVHVAQRFGTVQTDDLPAIDPDEVAEREPEPEPDFGGAVGDLFGGPSEEDPITDPLAEGSEETGEDDPEG